MIAYGAGRCEIALHGADNIAVDVERISESMASFVESSKPSVTAEILGLFDPDETFKVLHRNGVTNTTIEKLNSYLMHVARFAQSAKADAVDGGFSLLNDAHSKEKIMVNLCIVGKECTGFNVMGESRPYLNMSTSATAIIGSVRSIDKGEPVVDGRENYMNLIALRAVNDPDALVIHLFSGLGSATIDYLVQAWAWKLSQTLSPSSDAYRVGARKTPDGVVVDHGFLVFMRTMNAHLAETELQRLLARMIPSRAFQQHSSVLTVQDALKRVGGYPSGREFLTNNNIDSANAEQKFRIYLKALLE
jgi:hypothetical protein